MQGLQKGLHEKIAHGIDFGAAVLGKDKSAHTEGYSPLQVVLGDNKQAVSVPKLG